MRICDYHLHTMFSFDSRETIENICEKAVKDNIREIALTDHAEFPLAESSPWPDFQRRMEVIQACREKYGSALTIRAGAETGQPWRDPALEKELPSKGMDFVIASAHTLDGFEDPRSYVYTEENVRPFIRAYISQMKHMAETCDYDVIGHVTYLFRFIPPELTEKYPPESFKEEYAELFRAVISRGKGIEVNCSGIRMPSVAKTLPSPELIKLYRDLGGEVITIGSDGHSCRSAFLNLEAGYAALEQAGFRYATSFEGRKLCFYNYQEC